MPRRELGPAIRLGDDLSRASALKLQQQLAYELGHVLDLHGLSQEELANRIDKQPASVSKWLTMKAPMSAPAAKALDEAKLGLTTLETTFEALQQMFAKANRRRSSEAAARVASPGTTYDLFLASPMAASASQEAFDEERDSARGIADAFRTGCDFRVYYAGDHIAAEAEFDAPDIALEQNVQALLDVSYFVLILLQPLARPSSVMVEAGFALAHNIPSLYFVKDVEFLPYILKQAADHQSSLLPKVQLRVVRSEKEIKSLIRKHRGELMARLTRIS